MSRKYTELSLQLGNMGEMLGRLYQSGKKILKDDKDSFVDGAVLRLILDATAMLYVLLILDDKTQKRFIKHFNTGKPTDTFVLGKYVDDDGKIKRQYLTNGFIRSLQPEFDYCYEKLNSYSHPSKVYLDRIVKMDGNNLFINREVPKWDITGLLNKIDAVFGLVYKEFIKMLDGVEPKSDKYRIVYYSDTLLEREGKEPVPIKVYEY